MADVALPSLRFAALSQLRVDSGGLFCPRRDYARYYSVRFLSSAGSRGGSHVRLTRILQLEPRGPA